MAMAGQPVKAVALLRKNIIGLRNIISHAYDSVEPEMLGEIIQKNIPVLADEIRKMKDA